MKVISPLSYALVQCKLKWHSLLKQVASVLALLHADTCTHTNCPCFVFPHSVTPQVLDYHNSNWCSIKHGFHLASRYLRNLHPATLNRSHKVGEKEGRREEQANGYGELDLAGEGENWITHFLLWKLNRPIFLYKNLNCPFSSASTNLLYILFTCQKEKFKNQAAQKSLMTWEHAHSQAGQHTRSEKCAFNELLHANIHKPATE